MQDEIFGPVLSVLEAENAYAHSFQNMASVETIEWVRDDDQQ